MINHEQKTLFYSKIGKLLCYTVNTTAVQIYNIQNIILLKT